MRWTITTPAGVEPVTYAEVKAQMRLDDDEERDLVEAYIAAARQHAENVMERSLVTRSITAVFDDAESCATLELPRGPVIAIASVADANSATIAPSQYTLRRRGLIDQIYFTTRPTFPLTVEYTAGYGDAAADVPATARMGIKLHVAQLWLNREATSEAQQYEVPLGLAALYGLEAAGARVG